jgi:hypothetical protein
VNTAGTTYLPSYVHMTATSASANGLWDWQSQPVWPVLPSVVSAQAERDPVRDARLTPVEWLRRQVEDVCVRARMPA